MGDRKGERLEEQEWDYDFSGNTICQRDHCLIDGVADEESVITMEYDSRNRLETYTQNGKTTRYRYTSSGNVSEKVLPDGCVLTISYNSLGSMETRTSSDGQIAQEFHYDRLGRLRHGLDGEDSFL